MKNIFCYYVSGNKQYFCLPYEVPNAPCTTHFYTLRQLIPHKIVAVIALYATKHHKKLLCEIKILFSLIKTNIIFIPLSYFQAIKADDFAIST